MYGVSYFPAPEILVYRKDFFKEAGLDPEKPPRTWEELKSYAVRLAKRDANNNVIRAGLNIPVINPEVFIKPFLWQNDASVIDEEKEVLGVNSAGAVETFEYVKRLREQRHVLYHGEHHIQHPGKKSFRLGGHRLRPADRKKKEDALFRSQALYEPCELKISERILGIYRIHALQGADAQAQRNPEYAGCQEIFGTGVPEDRPGIKKVILEYAKYGKSAAVLSFTAISNFYPADFHGPRPRGGSFARRRGAGNPPVSNLLLSALGYFDSRCFDDMAVDLRSPSGRLESNSGGLQHQRKRVVVRSEIRLGLYHRHEHLESSRIQPDRVSCGTAGDTLERFEKEPGKAASYEHALAGATAKGTAAPQRYQGGKKESSGHCHHLSPIRRITGYLFLAAGFFQGSHEWNTGKPKCVRENILSIVPLRGNIFPRRGC